MIYRKRITKKGYGFSFTQHCLKAEFGKHVWYFGLATPYKPLWSLTSIRDVSGVETVSHIRRRERVTVYRAYPGVKLSEVGQVNCYR